MILFPDDRELTKPETCMACQRRLIHDEASAGLQDLDGSQAFICEVHLKSSAHLNCWVDFMIGQNEQLAGDVAGMFLTEALA